LLDLLAFGLDFLLCFLLSLLTFGLNLLLRLLLGLVGYQPASRREPHKQ
jgi:hypothetical protein